MSHAEEYDQNYTDYQANRAGWRKVVRRPWLRAAASFVEGPVVDLGCGVGALLARLPAGSIGLEVNRASIAHCQEQGLDVSYYDGAADDWALAPVAASSTRFDTLLVSHVLEHFDGPDRILRRLLEAAGPLGLRQVLVIVPGRAGFRHDATHRTFVDAAMLSAPELAAGTAFDRSEISWFPGNLRAIGDVFTYHEMRAAFRRA